MRNKSVQQYSSSAQSSYTITTAVQQQFIILRITQAAVMHIFSCFCFFITKYEVFLYFCIFHVKKSDVCTRMHIFSCFLSQILSSTDVRVQSTKSENETKMALVRYEEGSAATHRFVFHSLQISNIYKLQYSVLCSRVLCMYCCILVSTAE